MTNLKNALQGVETRWAVSNIELMSARQWHERHGQNLLLADLPLLIFFQQQQRLGTELATHRNGHPAAGFELLDEWRRHRGGCRGNDNGIKRGVRCPTVIAVAD